MKQILATASPSICGKATLLPIKDPLAPPQPDFEEPWQAQALTLADTMVQAGHFTRSDWAEAFGAALKAAASEGAPDTLETYYIAVLSALEALTETFAGIAVEARQQRRADWEAAYRRTPHGKPVTL